MKMQLCNATYGYDSANDCHNYGGDSRDDGVDDTTDGGNDGALRGSNRVSFKDFGTFWKSIITMITVEMEDGV